MKSLNLLKTGIIGALVLLMTGAALSFKTSDSKKAATVYHYDSDSMSPGAFSNAAHWAVGAPDENCVSPRDARPCKITVPEGSTLSSVLAGKNNSEVLDIAEGYLPEP